MCVFCVSMCACVSMSVHVSAERNAGSGCGADVCVLAGSNHWKLFVQNSIRIFVGRRVIE